MRLGQAPKMAPVVRRLTDGVLVSLAQDQRQTESIQLLQAQLENMTRLVLNLSVRVSQLQVEVRSNRSWRKSCRLPLG